MNNRFNVWKFFYDQTIETKNFDFQVKNILGLESTHPDSQKAKIGLNEPLD